MDGNEASAGRGGAYVAEAEGGRGGIARGGAVYASWNNSFGTFSIVDSSTLEQVNIADARITGNTALGGASSDGFNGLVGTTAVNFDGGNARGGAIFLGDLLQIVAIVDSHINENRAEGGRGGNLRDELAEFLPGGPRFAVGDGGEALGGGIHSAADELRLIDTSMLANVAQGGRGGNATRGQAGHGGAAEGGAIRHTGELFVRGTLEVTDPELNEGTITTSISGNDAIGGTGGNKRLTDRFIFELAGDGGQARGGGIATYGAGATIVGGFLSDNRAMGGAGGDGNAHPSDVGTDGGDNGDAFGGAIYAEADLGIQDSAFVLNKATGGNLSNDAQLLGGLPGASDGRGRNGGDGGSAFGGAIYGLDHNVQIADSGFTLNSALGGYGAPGAIGLGVISGPEVVSGDGGNGGDASGGALHVDIFFNTAAQVDVVDSILSSNVAIAGRGGSGAQGRNSEELHGGDGGRGGDGGDAFGGGAAIAYTGLPGFPNTGGDVTFVDSIVSDNRLIGGDGGYGGAGGWTEGDTVDGNTGGGGGVFVGDRTWEGGGNGGDARGGGIFLQDVRAEINRSSIVGNHVSSGWGGNGGHAGAAYFWGGTGGSGGDGGLAAGGGVARQGGELLPDSLDDRRKRGDQWLRWQRRLRRSRHRGG